MSQTRSLPLLRFACVAAGLVIVFSGQPAAGQDTSVGMTAEDLFGDLPIPYDGLGEIWIREDGTVFINLKGDQGTAFRMNAVGLLLTDRDGRITFSDSDASGIVIHRFEDVEPDVASARSAAYYVAGDFIVDYDAHTSRLSVQVLAADTSFDAVFDFVDARAPDSADPQQHQQAASPCGDAATCYASGHGYECCKNCESGYDCSCRALSNGCTCTPCKKLKAIGVILPLAP